MITLGEMVAFLPIPGGHIKLAERFVDPAFSFTMGWNYCYSWMITSPTEISAAALLINYWNQTVNNSNLSSHPSRSSQSPVLLFSASPSIWELTQIMTVLDSATGKILDRLFSMMASKVPKDDSLAGVLF
jgi:hypothetical protein